MFLAFVVLLAGSVSAVAASNEQVQLELLIRQLDALEATAQRGAQSATEPGQRYYFDYPRLATDIARIRQGLRDYLTPSRAQPRDPAQLSGHYTLNGAPMP
ncbi:integrative conjugative element protein, RAQPRD family [Pseudomonas protegens]|uniref:integrative conjugative element protein, RAQPRD family n=1 Tax=Pseudomonas protegens TaxID=380021 RepID=UPI002159F304|nr:RAQPRD family integrative conjugative element protein [Pseudomonas protegens]